LKVADRLRFVNQKVTLHCSTFERQLVEGAKVEESIEKALENNCTQSYLRMVNVSDSLRQGRCQRKMSGGDKTKKLKPMVTLSAVSVA